MRKRLLYIILSFAITIITLSLSVSAIGNLGDNEGYSPYSSTYIETNVDGNGLITEFSGITFGDDSNIYNVYLWIVDFDKTFEYLNCDDFIYSQMSAVEYVDLWNISNFYTAFNDEYTLSNCESVLMSINFIGLYVKSSYEYEDLSNSYGELLDENYELLDTLDELYSINEALGSDIENLQNDITDKSERIEEIYNDYLAMMNSRDYYKQLYEDECIKYNNKVEDYNKLFSQSQLDQRTISNLIEQINELELQLESSQKDGYLEAYNRGYSQALDDYDSFKRGFVTVISTPMYFLNSIIGFDLFGFNLFTVVQFILTLGLVFWVVKKLR